MYGTLRKDINVVMNMISLKQEPKLAFEDVDATELYPCVMFYSSNPGEKVKTHSFPIHFKDIVNSAFFQNVKFSLQPVTVIS